jgi:hypothetical protein
MPVRPGVREAQRTIAALDAAHAHAAGRLDQALARRAEVLAEQDRLVALARAAVGQAVADMANQVSAELAAQLLGLGLAEVRRLAKAHPLGATAANGRAPCPVGADG